MEFLKCKACGSFGMIPMDVTLSEQDSEDGDSVEIRGRITSEFTSGVRPEDHAEADESRFYSCHVCGDNWLSIRRLDTQGDCKVTFIHQMGVQPVLRRVAHIDAPLVTNETAIRNWEYYLDETEVEEVEWMDRLADRRKVLKAICTN